MLTVYPTGVSIKTTIHLLLGISFLFLNVNSFGQESDLNEVDDRPDVLKTFQGSDEEYQKVKEKYYKDNGLWEESTDGWTSVSKDEQIDCDLKFEIPNVLNQPTDLRGNWELTKVERVGNKDFDKEYGDPTLVHDFNKDNQLILNDNVGKFSHFLDDQSYWYVSEQTLTISSFNKEACLVETLDMQILEGITNQLRLSVQDPDGQEGVSYNLNLKLVEK